MTEIATLCVQLASCIPDLCHLIIALAHPTSLDPSPLPPDLQVIQLAEKLQLLCDGQRRVQQVASLTPGQPCLARYRGDGAGRWYRALVERCNPADNTATVGGVFAEMRGAV